MRSRWLEGAGRRWGGGGSPLRDSADKKMPRGNLGPCVLRFHYFFRVVRWHPSRFLSSGNAFLFSSFDGESEELRGLRGAFVPPSLYLILHSFWIFFFSLLSFFFFLLAKERRIRNLWATAIAKDIGAIRRAIA
jgi:hypothetical protein